jgi:acetyl-CoA acyltransferase 2
MAITAENLALVPDLPGRGDRVPSLPAPPPPRRRRAASNETFPLERMTKKGPALFERDEHNRPDTTLEGLKKLPKVFKKDGVVHAGAASGICDGAGSMVVAARSAAEKKGWQPIGRLVNWGVAGCDPTIMGIGPAPAIRALLDRAQVKLSEVDLFEVNEAFAPQYLAVEKELGLPREHTNVNGGAIAVGHPLGASGARLALTAVRQLHATNGRYALVTMCIGVGQGIAVIVERS